MSGFYFRLPNIDQLTTPQQVALDETQPLALTGGPGTGKSVVSLWRHIRNYNLGKRRSILLTYTKTLSNYLQNSCKAQVSPIEYGGISINPVALSIGSSYSWKKNPYKTDEIIVDEAQDLPTSFYKTLKDYAQWGISYGADDNQILYPAQCSTVDQLKSLLPDNISAPLDENFRNTYEIMRFAKSFFKNFYISQDTLDVLVEKNRRGPKPYLLFHSNTEKRYQAIIDLIESFHSETHNIAILLPLKDHVYSYYKVISARLNGKRVSMYVNDMDGCNIEGIHVTTFKSAKGLEFDTVIIPDFHNFSDNVRNYRVISQKDYFVALTRARTNLYLISNQELPFLDKSTYNGEKL